MAQDNAKPYKKVTWGQHAVPGSPSASDIHNAEGTYFLGRYRIVDEIGVGGMASVHLARLDGDGGFQRWVAIKKMHPHLIEDDSFVQMFLDEARVAARISHPNVAAVLELGKDDETYWIAMEYLHGEPLREVMRRSEEMGQIMQCDIACKIVADAAEGLHAAHELLGRNGEQLGLVHRDVTPHNLFVTYDGATKVVDFGIAKFHARMATTRAGTLKGKLAYMSPEQIRDQPLDRRTDIFALGVVLWEITTGQRLFRSDNDIDTIAKVQECIVPRPTTVMPGYPIELEKIVMKALAKNRNERFKTAREMSRALQLLLMKRNVFVAADEIATYMRDTFKDRIQKRDAHLRWAAEVTKMIDLGSQQEPPPRYPAPEESTFNSDVQPANVPKIRPAAGAPALEARDRLSRPPPADQYASPVRSDYAQRADVHLDYPPESQGPDGEQPTMLQEAGIHFNMGPLPVGQGAMPLDLPSLGNDIPLIDEDDQDETIVAVPKLDAGILRSTKPPAPPRPRTSVAPLRSDSRGPEPLRREPQRLSRDSMQRPLAPPQASGRHSSMDPSRPSPEARQAMQEQPSWTDPGSANRSSQPDFPAQRPELESHPHWGGAMQERPHERGDAIGPAYVHHSGNYPYAPVNQPFGQSTARVPIRKRPPMFVVVAVGVASAVLIFSIIVLFTSRQPSDPGPGPGAGVENPLEDSRHGFLAIVASGQAGGGVVPPRTPASSATRDALATLLVSCSPRCESVSVNGTQLGGVGDAAVAVAVPAGKRSLLKFKRAGRVFDEYVVPEANTQLPVRK